VSPPRSPGETGRLALGSARGVSLTWQEPILQPHAVNIRGCPAALNAAHGGVGWSCREPSVSQDWPLCCPQHRPSTARELCVGKAVWQPRALSPGKVITYSDAPLPLCPFSQLPATPEGSSTRTQPGKKKGGKSTAKSKAKKMGPAKAVEPKSYTEEHRAVKVPTQGGVPEKAQANLQSHSGAPSPVQTPIASLWCRSSETSLLQEPNDNKSGQHPPGSTSQKLLKLRGEMSRPVLEKPHKTAWLTSHSESSLPEEHTSKTSGFVPLMHRRTKSLPCQPAQNGEGLLWRGMSSPH